MKQSPQTDKADSQRIEAIRFLEDVIDAFQNYGVSTSQMRFSLEGIAHKLGLHGQFFITSDYIQAVLWGSNKDQQHTYMSISSNGNYNLSILAHVYNIVDEVVEDEISITEGRNKISEIDTNMGYSNLVIALAYIFCGAGFSLIIGGTLMDMYIAGLISLLPFIVSKIASINRFFSLLNELLSGISVTMSAILISNLIPDLNINVIIFGALVTLIPGFGLTMASSEIINKNSIGGLIWLNKAVVSGFQLVGGYAIGSYLCSSLGLEVTMQSPEASMSPIWLWFAVIFLVWGLAVTMNVGRRSLWAVILGGMVVWGAMQMGNLLGYWQGTFLGAAAMMLFAHWFSMRFNLPDIIIILPCVMLLVPGLSALQALYIGGTEGVMQGISAFYPVLVLVASIIGGVVVGGTLVNPNHILSRKYFSKSKGKGTN